MKVSLILLIALAASALLRRRSASVRHWVLAAAIVCAAAVPALEVIVPTWPVAIGPTQLFLSLDRSYAKQASRSSDSASGSNLTATRRPDDAQRQTTGARRPGSSLLRGANALAWIWMTGTAASLAALLVGFVRLRRAAAGAHRILSGYWAEAAVEIARESGLGRPVTLLCGSHPGLLVTWGLLRPKILVPPAALTWDERRIRVVLHHELAHVARGDWATQLAAEVLRCVYWFTPLTWIACRRLRDESERAADDAVLLRGVPPADYAAHLLELARSMTHDRRAWAAAPAIARPSSLERRVTAMLNHHLDRQPMSRGARLACASLVVTLTVVVASVAFAQAGSARVSGSVADPSGAPLPDVTVSLTHRSSGVTHAAPTDQAGAFSFPTLVPGEYLVETRAVGFAAVKDTLTLAPGDSTQRDFRLNIGSIEETITVGEPVAGARPARVKVDVAGFLERFRGQRLQPPIKLTHTAPIYPQALQAAGIEGQVVLAGRVAADGSVTGIEVVTPAHQDLVSAATDAARQWRFEPTRLWGTPVEVPIKMTFNFRAQR